MIRASSFVGLFAGATSTENPRVQARGFSFDYLRPGMWVLVALIVAATTVFCFDRFTAMNHVAPVVAAAPTPEPLKPLSPEDAAVLYALVHAPPIQQAPAALPAPALKPGQEIYDGYIGRWVDVVATGYSPHDPIDGDYHATKGKWRWITADGETNVLEEPYGIAVPHTRGKPRWRYGTKMIVPVDSGYLSTRTNRVFTVDDTGSTISRNTRNKGVVHIDLRFRTTGWAQKYGTHSIRVFIVESENTGE